jgi:hypothetical protein
MEWGRATETERMPRLVVGYTELGGSKLKKGKGFLKPKFRASSETSALAYRRVRQVHRIVAGKISRQAQPSTQRISEILRHSNFTENFVDRHQPSLSARVHSL